LTSKRLLIGLAGLFLLMALLALIGWFYIRSESFNHYIAEQLKAKLKEYGLRAEIGGTEVSLVDQIARLRDFKIYNDQSGQLIASVNRVELTVQIRDPYALSTKREIALKKLNLEGLDLHIDIDQQGRTNFEGLREAPSQPGALTFDYSQLLASLTGVSIHFKDRSRQIEADLTNLKATAQPQSQNPATIGLELDGESGRFSLEGRETNIEKLETAARVSGSGAEIVRLRLNSGLGEVTSRGKIDDWKSFRYGFDFDTRMKLDAVARVFLPDVGMKGLAASKGRVEGAATKYKIKGSLTAHDLTVNNTKLLNTQVAQFNLDGVGNRIDFILGEILVQSVTVDNVRIEAIAINNVRGDYANRRTVANASGGNVAGVEWPESEFSGLTLGGLKATFTSTGGSLRYEVTTDANLKEGTISGVNFNNASTQATVDNAALLLTGIKGSVFGGNVTGDFTLPLERGAASRAKGSFTDLQTKDVFSYISSKGGKATADEIPLSGTVSGDAEISFTGDNLRSINGTIKASFAGKANEASDAIPVSGNAVVTARNGVFNFDQLQLSTDASKLMANGSLSVNGESDLRISLTSNRAEQLLQIARSIEVARPTITEYEPQIIGDFKFDGRLSGQLEKATIEGDLNAATVGLRDAILGEFSGHLLVSPEEVRVEKGLISAFNGGSAKFDLITPLDSQAASGKLDAVLDRIGLDNILAALGSPNATQFIAGDVSGEAHLTGLPGALNGAAQFNLINGTIAEQPAQLATAALKFDRRNVLLERLEVQLPQSHMTASGEMNIDEYSFKLGGKADQISLEGLAQSFEIKETQIEGSANADLIISGRVIPGKQPDLDWESLQVFLLAESKGVKVNGRDTGELKFGARTSPGGRIDFGLVTGILSTIRSSETEDKPEVIRGNVELRKPGRPIVIESELVDQNLVPLFEIFAPELNPTIAGTISGKLRLEGPTVNENGDPSFDRLSGGLTLTATSLQFANNPVKVDTPLTIVLEAMQIKVGNTRITGDGINLNFGGTFGLRGEAGMNFSLNGTVNLHQLPPVSEGILLSGTIAIDATLTGTAEAPILTGKSEFNGFGFSSNDLPIFVSDGVGRLTFSGDQIMLESFKANANDGMLEVDGVVKLARLRPSEWKYNIKAENATIDLQDISANVSGQLTLSGTPQGQVLAGTITVPQAEYAPDIDLDNLFTAGNAALPLTGFGVSGGEILSQKIPPISLNMRVEARDSLIVRNDNINAVGSAALNIRGTFNDPDVTGRIETDGGLVRFRGQRYEITTGYLDLPQGNIDPQLNLSAEGQISGYRVIIGFIGPINDIDLILRSEPQLVRDEIIALITTGRTESGTLFSQDPLRSSLGTAASLLSSGFISKPTEQLLGLSRFQIDPIIRPNANPAARLTVGQQLSRNLYVSYSTNLASDQDQTALGEYTISNRFSAVATYTQGGSLARQGVRDGAFTIELRGRKRFSLGFQPGSPSGSTTGATGGTSDPLGSKTAPARPKLPSAGVRVSPVPDLKLSDRRLRELLPVMTQGFSRSLARLGERRLREYLQEHGYFFADVGYRCDPQTCSGDNLQVFYDIEPGSIYELKEIRIEGTEQVKPGDIQEQLQSQIASQVGGIPFLEDLPIIGGYVRGLTSNDRLRNDEETIRRYLTDVGFRNARVKSRLAVKPENDDLVVLFEVEEGVQSDIAGVNVRGNTAVSLEELRESVPIHAGEAFSFTRARAGTQEIKQLYAQLGFLGATVDLEIADVDEDSVLLVYNVNEGARAFVSEIEIKGLTKTGPNWVRRYIGFRKGDLLTPAMIRQTQRDLYATNSFREVNIRAEPVGGDDGSAHRVIVDLTEAKPLLLVYGLGYSTDDGVRGSLEVANTNFRGSLDSLTLRLRGSRREQFAQLALTDLRPFSWRLPTTISVFYNRNNNLQPFVRRRIIDGDGKVVDSDEGEGFGFQRFAAFIQTERKLGERTSIRFRYNLERASLFGVDPNIFPDTDVTRNERAIRLGFFSAGFTDDTRDSVLNPTRGHLLSADHSIAARMFGGNESFNKFFGTYQTYRTLDPEFPLLGKSTLAFSARLGLAAIFRFSDRNRDGMIDESEKRLPISERFFSGGATTLRGFRFETAGPQDILEPRPDRTCNQGVPCDLPTLIPIGGDALTIFNFELRYPMTERLRLVPFYDLGNVFRRVRDINFSGMTNTVGLGLRINTPLGPVGVDYGFLIDPPSYMTRSGAVLRQPRGAFHIRLGQSF
jgi:outer membrane protein assembly complex protein YaeT